MPRKRVKDKKKKTINLKTLTIDLKDALFYHISMSELMDEWALIGYWDEKNKLWRPFDKRDPKKCAEVYKMHGPAIMDEWQKDKANKGLKPWIWWAYYCPEVSIDAFDKELDWPHKQTEYLEQKGLLTEGGSDLDI